MLDWFIIVAPLVLLPIALLVFFVGCTFDGSNYVAHADVTFRIEFFYAGDPDGRSFRFTVHNDDMIFVAGDVTDAIQATDPPPGQATPASHQFSELVQSFGEQTLRCIVEELVGSVGVPLISGGPGCQLDLEKHGDYYVVFRAGAGPDLSTPESEFEGNCPFAAF